MASAFTLVREIYVMIYGYWLRKGTSAAFLSLATSIVSPGLAPSDFGAMEK